MKLTIELDDNVIKDIRAFYKGFKSLNSSTKLKAVEAVYHAIEKEEQNDFSYRKRI